MLSLRQPKLAESRTENLSELQIVHNAELQTEVTMFQLVNRGWTPADLSQITRSLTLCVYSHQEPRKYTGEPYYTHPVRVAMAVAACPSARPSWVCAALLHDVPEDWKKTPFKSQADAERAVRLASSEEALRYVLQVTNVKQPGFSRADQKKYDRERLMWADGAAKIIKMRDRIDNLFDMGGAPDDFKLLYCDESVELEKAVGDADEAVAEELLNAVARLRLSVKV